MFRNIVCCIFFLIPFQQLSAATPYLEAQKYQRSFTIYCHDTPESLVLELMEVPNALIIWNTSSIVWKKCKASLTSLNPHNLLVLIDDRHHYSYSKLAESEHFDIAVFSKPPKYQSLATLALSVFIQDGREWTLSRYDRRDKLVRGWFFCGYRKKKYQVISSYKKKILIKHSSHHSESMKTPFVAGMNLVNFKALGGVYPSSAMIKKELLKYQYHPSDDWRMHNFVISSGRLLIIDTNESYMPNMRPKEGKRFVSHSKFVKYIKLMDERDPHRFERRLRELE